MEENGPTNMYKIKPLYDSNPHVDLPTCMYKANSIYKKNDAPERQENEESAELLKFEEQQMQVLTLLEEMKSRLIEIKKELNINDLAHEESSLRPETVSYQDIVIKVNPDYPPLSLWIFYQLLAKQMKVRFISYVHSSLASVPEFVKQLKSVQMEVPCDMSITIIWKGIGKDAEMVVSPVVQGVIEGEVNIARYLSRLISFKYEDDPVTSSLIDNWLEIAHSSLIHGNNKERQAVIRSLNSYLGKEKFLVGNDLSLADIVMWSAVIQAKLHHNLPGNVTKWWKLLESIDIFSSFKQEYISIFTT